MKCVRNCGIVEMSPMKLFRNDPQPALHFSLGFTLLELLVVISVIAILIGLSTASFSTAQRKGRDTKRRADIKAMQNAFEQYFSLNSGSYGANCASMASSGGTTLLPNGLPTDPQTGAAYPCNSSGATGTNSYCVCAQLEGGGGNSSSNGCTFTAPGPTVRFFCMTNLQ